jgi:hypothetical protein
MEINCAIGALTAPRQIHSMGKLLFDKMLLFIGRFDYRESSRVCQPEKVLQTARLPSHFKRHPFDILT